MTVLRGEGFNEKAIDGWVIGRRTTRKFTLDEKRRISQLANNRGDNLSIGREQGRVRHRHVRPQLLVKFGQPVVRDHGEHVVFDVVIHVPVDEPVERSHEDGERVQAMVEDVFAQSGVLSEAIDPLPPMRRTGIHECRMTAVAMVAA